MNILTCVYCGHEYPEGTPPHGSKVLTDHIKVCDKHPMRELELENERLRKKLSRFVCENDILDEIFDQEPKWKQVFRLWWCDLCDTFSIGCPSQKCSGSSCNGAGCPECIDVHNDFNKLAKTNPKEYLNEQEQLAYEKIKWLRRYMKESLAENEYEINWKRLKQQGQLCVLSEGIFAKEIAESYAKQPDVKFGEY